MLSLKNEHTKWSSQLAGHPLVWLTVVTLLVILIACVWMSQSRRESDEASARKSPPETASIRIRQIEKIIKREPLAITNENDEHRSRQYLREESLQNTLDVLLNAADGHIANGQFAAPPGDNAWNDYQKILKLRPDDPKAEAGQIRVISALVDNAETAMETGDFADAENWLRQLDIIQPGGGVQMELRNDIRARTERREK